MTIRHNINLAEFTSVFQIEALGRVFRFIADNIEGFQPGDNISCEIDLIAESSDVSFGPVRATVQRTMVYTMREDVKDA